MRRLRRSVAILQAIGWENLPKRLWHTLKVKSGWKRYVLPGGNLSPEQMQRQFRPGYSADDAPRHWQKRAERFFASRCLADLRPTLRQVVDDATWQRTAGAASTDLDRGMMEMFSRLKVPVGQPVDFNRDPIHGLPWPVMRHWSDYQTFDPALADIKCVWELSRFSVAYGLARDWTRNANHDAARQFAELTSTWHATNPYGLTPQWICGQEATFRLMGLLFATCVMLDDLQDEQVLQSLSEIAWYTGRSIEQNIAYARSQKNNHAISEAVGLWTIGVLFPEFRQAARWKAFGQRVLREDLARQVYADGSYVQHSMSYHRVMMDDVLWGVALGRACDEPLDDDVREPLERATGWLAQFVDEASGRVPNYGANDGANILPLSCSDYLDYRPTLQAAHFAVHGRRCLQPGPWDEKMLWLFGVDALQSPVMPVNRATLWSAPQGGYYILRGEHSHAMTRVHSYVDRPGQADMLHVDLWYGSTNVLRDGGSYEYFGKGSWAHYFKSTAAHNTVEIDKSDQMEKGPRFLWLYWTRSQLKRFEQSPDGRVRYLEGEHFGYTRLKDPVVHRRGILAIDDTYLIVDDLLGEALHHVALRWRLHPADWRRDGASWSALIADRELQISVGMPPGFDVDLKQGEETSSIEGWESMYYGEKVPVPTLIAQAKTQLPIRLITLVHSPDQGIEFDLDATSFDARSPVSLRSCPNEFIKEIATISHGRVRCVPD